MKKDIPVGLVGGIIAVVVCIAAFFIYRGVFSTPPAPGDDGKPIPTLSKADMAQMHRQDAESHPAPKQ